MAWKRTEDKAWLSRTRGFGPANPSLPLRTPESVVSGRLEDGLRWDKCEAHSLFREPHPHPVRFAERTLWVVQVVCGAAGLPHPSVPKHKGMGVSWG